MTIKMKNKPTIVDCPGAPVGCKPNNSIMEKIICAANHYDDGQIHLHQPINIRFGFVVCGMRHHNCIFIANLYLKKLGNRTRNKIKQSATQGFLTTTNRFVHREEAMEIALVAGQAKEEGLHQKAIGLFSEDIY